MSDQTGWEGRAQQLGTRIATVWTLSQALGQAKENKYALESLDGYIVCSCWELKTEIPVNSLSRDASSSIPNGIFERVRQRAIFGCNPLFAKFPLP